MTTTTDFQVRPIGIIRTPFKTSNAVPIQSSKSNTSGYVEIAPEYLEGIKSLDEFTHIILVYWFHRGKDPKMTVKPYLDTKSHGLFATRAPSRPNPIGISIVRFTSIEGLRLNIEGVDMLDNTPLLDIKPFVPEFDNRLNATSGWLAKSPLFNADSPTADDRFEK
jgi:tRNA-Thr(GGU) m(6)t(6)A37 methyltransferase TsaA